MYYKISIVIILLSILNYTGCYSDGVITRDELANGFSSNISLLTSSNETYYFSKNSYKVVRDTLSGTGQLLKSDNTMTDFKGKLALNDIELMTGKKIDGGKTALLILGVAGISLLVYFLVNLDSEIRHSFDHF